jgi:hypothetical protein
MHGSEPKTRHPGREQGFALILGLLFTIIVLGVTFAGTLVLKAHQVKTRTNFVTHGQAANFAKSGLIEALGWMRKQSSQPVLALEPQLDLLAVPAITDTIEPDIGIVREFQINGQVWGRYEVWKDWPTDPDPSRLAWRNQFRCEDISAFRGEPNGTVWRLTSIGYVFRRVNPAVAFRVQPNQVLGQEIVEVEVRRLALSPPGQAALCVRNGGTCLVRTKGRVLGGDAGAGIYYRLGNGTPSVSGTGATVTGTPAQSAATVYDDSLDAVFGLTLDELRAVANYVITNAADFPSPVPQNTLVVCEVPVTFTDERPLRGTGVVVCLSDLTVDPSSYSSFNGLLYVGGNLVLREPSEITGATIVGGTVLVQGSADLAILSYDDGILNILRNEVGSYRLASAFSHSRRQRF